MNGQAYDPASWMAPTQPAAPMQAPPGGAPQQQQQQAGPVGAVKFVIDKPEGPLELNEKMIFQKLQETGANPVGITPDGMTITFQDQKGLYDVDTTDILKGFGHQAVNVVPQNTSTDHINPMWRAAILKLPDDDAKKVYLESKLRKEGEESPKVTGAGRDWYAYSNNLGQWVNLTNSPDWDMSDLAEGAIDVTRGASSVLGGAVGGGAGFFGGAGVGSIPGAALGAGVGSAAAEALQRGALAAFDPEFRDATTLGQQLGATGKEAALDVALGAGVGGALKYAPKAIAALRGSGVSEESARALGTKLATSGPLSSVAKAVGAPIEKLGSGIASTAAAIDKPLGREVVQALTPGLQAAQGLGVAAKIPELATVYGAKGVDALSRSKFLKELLSEEQAAKFGKFASELVETPAPSVARNIMKEGLLGSRNVPGELTAEMVLRRLGKRFGSEKAGQTAGDIVGGIGKIGDTALGAGEVGARAMLGGIRGAGRGAQAVGGALRRTGEALQPVEPYTLLRKLSEDSYNDYVGGLISDKKNRKMRLNPAQHQNLAMNGEY